MEYSKLVAVSGIPGLFELINSKTDGAILRSLEDQTTRFVSSRVHNFSHLESIEVYTSKDNVNLVEVFNSMEKSGKALPNDKESADVKNYFGEVYPEMDFDRVYASDMKKMVKWFDILQKNKVEIKLSEQEEEETEEETASEVEAEPETPPPAKKTAAKKKAPAAKSEETPKKTARKKAE